MNLSLRLTVFALFGVTCLPAAVIQAYGTGNVSATYIPINAVDFVTDAQNDEFGPNQSSGNLSVAVLSTTAEVFAQAGLGVWKASVSLGALEMPSGAYNTAYGQASAFSSDDGFVLHVPGHEPGDVVTLTYTLSLDHFFGVGGPYSYGRVRILSGLSGHAETGYEYIFQEIPGGPNITSGDPRVFDPSVSFTFDVPVGTPLELAVLLWVEGQIDGAYSNVARSAVIDYSHTLTWAGAQISQGGVPIINFSITSNSGFNYNQSAVPEPSTGLLLTAAVGFCGLWRGLQRRH